MTHYLDDSQLSRFVSILPPISERETHFVCLAARRKYLTEEQTAAYEMPGNKLFGDVLVKQFNWQHAVAKAYSSLMYKRTPEGLEYPINSIVCFGSIDPSNILSGFQDFSNYILTNIANKKLDQKDDWSFLHSIDKKFIRSIHRASVRSNFIHLDMDISDIGYYINFFKELNKHDIEYHLIQTQGGYHCLILKSTLRNKPYRFSEELENLISQAKSRGEDITLPKSNLVPLPGTLQNNHLVQLISLF